MGNGIPLDSRLGKVPHVSAASITQDGTLVVILVDEMARSINLSKRAFREERVAAVVSERGAPER
jgi:hypothetical protein